MRVTAREWRAYSLCSRSGLLGKTASRQRGVSRADVPWPATVVYCKSNTVMCSILAYEGQAMKQSRLDVSINIRAQKRQRDLIDQAADRLGRSRSEFMLDAACREAED
ncbi:MAG: DUF1778 domain-containing protein, partial [Planctomycetia bacterium]